MIPATSSNVTQEEMDELFARKTTNSQLREMVASNAKMTAIIHKLLDVVDSDTAMAILLTFIKIGNNPIPLVSAALHLGYQFTDDQDESFLIGTHLLNKVFTMGLYKLTAGHQLIPLFTVDRETEFLLSLKTFDPPLLNKPIPVEEHHQAMLSVNKYLVENEYPIVTSLDVINKLNQIAWKLTDISRIDNPKYHPDMKRLTLIKKALGWNRKFHFKHAYDFRGRFYSHGYHLNYQGTPYDKASLTFAKGEKVEGKDGDWDHSNWLYIDLANSLGHSKCGYDERIAYAKEWLTKDEAIVHEKAHLVYKAVAAIEAYEAGKPVYHNCLLDASASGLQIMSLLAGDRHGMALTNLGTQNYNDPYQSITDIVAASSDTKYARKDVKSAAMKGIYNSVAIPEQVFGKDLKYYEEAMNISFSGAMTIMRVFNKCFDGTKAVHSWTMPDGFQVHMTTTLPYNRAVLTAFGKLALMGKKVTPNPNAWRSLVPNIIHSLDAYIAREVVRRCNFEVACIHDCFSCHPNNCSKLIKAYNEVLQDIYNSNMLECLVAQFRGEKIEYAITGNDTSLLGSLYSIN